MKSKILAAKKTALAVALATGFITTTTALCKLVSPSSTAATWPRTS